MIENSPFFTPPNKNGTLWRYMDFTKLLSLLENNHLFLPRSDMFEDPFEGVYPKATVELMRDPKRNGGYVPHAFEDILQFADKTREKMFISCWYANEHESAAMWKLYLQSPEGIAIRTDYEALSHALEESDLSVMTTLVKYVDYEKTVIPFGNLFYPFVHKRLSFSHENEMRVIVWSEAGANKPKVAEDASFVTIGVKPHDLIKSIHVSPQAPRWFGQLVEQVARRYGLTCSIERSSLYERQSY